MSQLLGDAGYYEEYPPALEKSNLTQKRSEKNHQEQWRSHIDARMRHAQKMEAVGALAGGIAHDFNNALSVILGYAELALDDAGRGGIAPGYFQQILRAGYRARDLVQQILTFSHRSEQGALPIQVQPIVKEAAKLLRASLPATIDIQVDARSEALVKADPVQIHQMMMNLGSNAGYAMRLGGGILKMAVLEEELGPEMVDTSAGMRPGRYLKLQVSDTGHGIAPAVIDRIFEPYFSTKPLDEGSGMGLAVVQDIVHACGGIVTVESRSGEGSRFGVYLPILEAGGSAGRLCREEVPMGSERILFVDDEPPIVELMREMLSRLGYHVTVCTSSSQALAIFGRQPDAFDLVLTDYTMPHITGDRLAEKLKAIRPGIPIAICSGYSPGVPREELERLGVSEMIVKPVIRGELAAAIRRMMDR